jgi:hypothetical protein
MTDYRCPGCRQPSTRILSEVQAFCTNDDCHVFLWNPSMSLDELARTANFVELDLPWVSDEPA